MISERELAVRVIASHLRQSGGRTTQRIRRVSILFPGALAKAQEIVSAELRAKAEKRKETPAEKRPISYDERAIVERLSKVSFPSISAIGRVVRSVQGAGSAAQITERQAEVLLAAGHAFRKQLGGCIKPNCEKCGAPKERT